MIQIYYVCWLVPVERESGGTAICRGPHTDGRATTTATRSRLEAPLDGLFDLLDPAVRESAAQDDAPRAFLAVAAFAITLRGRYYVTDISAESK